MTFKGYNYNILSLYKLTKGFETGIGNWADYDQTIKKSRSNWLINIKDSYNH